MSTTALLLAGIVLVAAGLLFVAQGAGLILWPAESFMLNEKKWVYYGGAIAVVGLVLVIISRR